MLVFTSLCMPQYLFVLPFDAASELTCHSAFVHVPPFCRIRAFLHLTIVDFAHHRHSSACPLPRKRWFLDLRRSGVIELHSRISPGNVVRAGRAQLHARKTSVRAQWDGSMLARHFALHHRSTLVYAGQYASTCLCCANRIFSGVGLQLILE